MPCRLEFHCNLLSRNHFSLSELDISSAVWQEQMAEVESCRYNAKAKMGKIVNYDRKQIIAAVGCNLKMRYNHCSARPLSRYGFDVSTVYISTYLYGTYANATSLTANIKEGKI